MNRESAKILIVGSDGMIGSALMSSLVDAGEIVIGTTRRKKLRGSKLYLDLSDNARQWAIPSGVQVAVILAGESKVEECQQYPERTRKINVDNIIDLANQLFSKGIFVIYMSTSAVFDGSKSFRKAEETLSPITEYGKQRADVESHLSCFADSVTILRATKVVGSTVPLFREWSARLRANKSIHPFSDMTLAPIPLKYVVSVLKMIIDRRTNGMFQLSGDRDLSYKEVAFMEAEYLGLKTELIQPIMASQYDGYKEPVVKYTTLDMERLKDIFGIIPPNSEWILHQIFSILEP